MFASVDAAAVKRSPEPIPPADGEDLVVQPTVRLGSGRADFAAFYEQHHPRVARALAVTLGDAELATEATDEAMVRAYQRWKQVSSLDNPGGWVYRVGLNWSRSVLRRRRIHRRVKGSGRA